MTQFLSAKCAVTGFLSFAICLGACASQREVPKIPHVFVLQAKVERLDAFRIFVQLPGGPVREGREVDISRAIYQNVNAEVVAPFPLHVGDQLIIVVNGESPLNVRVHTNRSLDHSNKFMPLKAIVMELVAKNLGG